MADFSVRSDSVNVEQIMEQIRTRIREKRGVDYTEQQIRELAAVKLEKFLDPRGVRSDLLDQFRKAARPAYEPADVPNFAFEDATLFESHRTPIRWLRKLLLPILKLFFNPNPLIQALHIQAQLNTLNDRREAARRQLDQLYYELIHNLVLETTRLGIDVKNLKMRLESVSSRLEFNERRARALESVVVYRPSGEDERPQRQERDRDRPDRSARHQQQQAPSQRQYTPPLPPTVPASAPSAIAASVDTAGAISPVSNPNQPPAAGAASAAEGPGQRSRRRRRRRGRRGGGSAPVLIPASGAPATAAASGGEPAGNTPDMSADSEDAQETFGESAEEGAAERERSEPAPTPTSHEAGAVAAELPTRDDRPAPPAPAPAPIDEGHPPPVIPGPGDPDAQ